MSLHELEQRIKDIEARQRFHEARVIRLEKEADLAYARVAKLTLLVDALVTELVAREIIQGEVIVDVDYTVKGE